MGKWDFISKIKAAERRDIEASDSKTYEKSIPLDDTHPLTQHVKEICETFGINPAPKLLIHPSSFPRALASHRAVVIPEWFPILPPEGTLRQKVIGIQKAAIDHEIAHVVFNDGEMTKEVEFRADRFAQFLGMNSKMLSEFLKAIDKKNITTKYEYERQGKWKKRLLVEWINFADRFVHGNLGDRLENMTAPLKPYEIDNFKKAITRYNKRAEQLNATETGDTSWQERRLEDTPQDHTPPM